MDAEEKRQGFWSGNLRRGIVGARYKAAVLRAHGECATAESTLASAHRSCAGSYSTRKGRMAFILAVWHFFRARVHAHKALSGGTAGLTPNHLDVISSVLRKSPSRRDVVNALMCAEEGITRANVSGSASHTRALLHIGAGICGEKLGHTETVWSHFSAASELALRIEEAATVHTGERVLHLKRQLVRILRECGLYFAYRADSGREHQIRGLIMLSQAEELAAEVSPDQLAKIRAARANARSA